jgi:hypothetical protein
MFRSSADHHQGAFWSWLKYLVKIWFFLCGEASESSLMMISWWSKHVGVILIILMCEIWISVLLQTSALVGPLHIVNWNARRNSEIYSKDVQPYSREKKGDCFFLSFVFELMWKWCIMCEKKIIYSSRKVTVLINWPSFVHQNYVCQWDFFLGGGECNSPPPQWARASSFTRFLNHTQRRITVGRTPLDEWSSRLWDLYLTTYNTHNRQTSFYEYKQYTVEHNSLILLRCIFLHCFVQRHVSALLMSHLQVDYFS